MTTADRAGAAGAWAPLPRSTAVGGPGWAAGAVTIPLGLLAAVAATTTLALHVLLWAFVTSPFPEALDCPVGGQPAPSGVAHPAAGCRLDDTLSVVGWTLTALVALVLLTTVLFVLQPVWRVRRSGLVPLTHLHAAELRDELARLTDAVGVRTRPRFLVDPVARSTGGVVFGRDGRPLVRLDAGLIALRASNPATFRAVVLHELAHLRNRDVTATCLTVAIWRAYLLVTVLPSLAAAALLVSHPGDQRELLLAALLPLPLVLLARNAVLRRREHHADVTAAQLLGSPAPYLPALRPAGRAPLSRRLPLRTHPSLQARATLLAAPTSLHRPRFTDHLVAGTALQVGVYYLAWNLFFGVRSDPVTVVSLVWGAALAVSLGGAVRAARAFRAAGGTERAVLLRPCAGLAAGVGLGQWVVLGTPQWPGPGPVLVLGLLFGALVLLGTWADRAWDLARAARPGVLRWAARGSVGGTVLVLTVSPLSLAAFVSSWTTLWSHDTAFVAQLLRGAGGGPTAVDEALITGVWLPLVQLTDAVQRVGVPWGPALLWAVPLLIAPLRSDRRLVKAGLWATAAWCGFALLARATVRETVAEAVRDSEAIRMVLSAWEISAVLATQFVVCLFVAGWWRTPLLRSMVAGAVTGVSCGAVLWLLFVFDACVPLLSAAKTGCPASVDLDYGTTVLTMIMIGTCVSAPLGHVGGTLLRRRTTPRLPLSPAPAGDRPRKAGDGVSTVRRPRDAGPVTCPSSDRSAAGDVPRAIPHPPDPGAERAPRGQRVATRGTAAAIILLLAVPFDAPPVEVDASGPPGGAALPATSPTASPRPAIAPSREDSSAGHVPVPPTVEVPGVTTAPMPQ